MVSSVYDCMNDAPSGLQLLADMSRLWYNRVEKQHFITIRGKFVGHPTRFVIHYDTQALYQVSVG